MQGVKQQIGEVRGYIEMAMYDDAKKVLERLPAELKSSIEALTLGVTLYRELGEYEQMVDISRQLVSVEPGAVMHWLNYAYASRYIQGLEASHDILQKALCLFPRDPDVLYAAAWHEAVLSDLESAQEHLLRAIDLRPSLREIALLDPELGPMIES